MKHFLWAVLALPLVLAACDMGDTEDTDVNNSSLDGENEDGNENEDEGENENENPPPVVQEITVDLYKGALFSSAEIIDSFDMEDALSYISEDAESNDNYFIVVTSNGSITPQTFSYSNKTVGITLMADSGERTVQLASSGSMFTVESGVTFSLENNVILKGIDNNTGFLVKTDNSGAFIMNGGKITGNSGRSGVYIYNSTFTMNGGKISGNTAGSGVSIYNSTFTMNDGEISGNTTSIGAGVNVNNSSTFTMYGGKISGNTARICGGGVSISGPDIDHSSTFTMYGGEISGNTANAHNPEDFNSSPLMWGGGGVFGFSYSTFIMHGGTISRNTSHGRGGGVYLWGNFTKTAEGGVITGYGDNTITGNKVVNTAINIESYKGHAVCIYTQSGEPLKILNKTVTGNKALQSAPDDYTNEGWTE